MSRTSTDSKHDSSNLEKDLEKLNIEEVDPVFERNTIRQIDWRMLPLLGLLYAIALIDRTNMGIARVAGMGKDLELEVGDRYSIVSCLYFVPYILLQLPSNLVLRKFGPRNSITFYVVSWGAVQLGMGFSPNWGVLIVCRLLLGVFEAGFFPGVVFIITTWYRRHETQKRLALFYLTSIVIGGFSSILAYALQLLKGKSGLNGWQWIFILEGVITLALGVLSFLYLPPFPDQNKFLTHEQTQLVLKRVQMDRGDALPDELTSRVVFHHLGDWTVWAYSLMFMCSTMPAYAISYFITIILASMGWNTRDSFLLSAPPYVTAAIVTFTFAYYSDKTKLRAIFIAGLAIITTVGIAITGWAESGGARYFGLFLATAGASGCIPAILTYNANNIVSHSKRAVSTAMIVMWGGIGGIFATTAFRQADYPRYINGVWATIGCQLLTLTLLGLLTLNYARKNRLQRAGKLKKPLEGQPGFLYTL